MRELFDERHEAVRRMIPELIEAAYGKDTKVSICGQAPGDSSDFTASMVEVKRPVAESEKPLETEPQSP